MWPELPEWAKPDLWLDENNALRFYTDSEWEPETIGATWWHKAQNSETGWCAGGFRWKPSKFASGPVWDLIQREPLTIAPSLHCLGCGAHGFIREGKWIPV